MSSFHSLLPWNEVVIVNTVWTCFYYSLIETYTIMLVKTGEAYFHAHCPSILHPILEFIQVGRFRLNSRPGLQTWRILRQNSTRKLRFCDLTAAQAHSVRPFGQHLCLIGPKDVTSRYCCAAGGSAKRIRQNPGLATLLMTDLVCLKGSVHHAARSREPTRLPTHISPFIKNHNLFSQHKATRIYFFKIIIFVN